MAENGKNNFLLPNRLDAVVSKLSDKQAGVLFKGILGYANKGTVAEFEDGMVSVVFEMARQEIDYNTDQYVKTCIRNAQNGKLGGAPKGNSNAKKQPSGCLNNRNNRVVEKTTQNNPKQPKTTETTQDDVDVDVDMSCYDTTSISNDMLITQKDPQAGTFRAAPKTKIQKFGVWWVKTYYPNLYETAGAKATGAWFKRYGKAISEILNLADGNVPLAISATLATQEQMAEFQKRKGEPVQWGLESISRNFTDNFSRAQEILKSGTLPQEVIAYAK